MEETEEIYLAGGCLWGVQEYVRHLPGVVWTEAGRANGSSNRLDGHYDGYAECVRTRFSTSELTLTNLLHLFFEAIDPYSVNRQGNDVGEKYRTGIYSRDMEHLKVAKNFIASRPDAARIVVEVGELTRYLRSAEEHQDRLKKHPNDDCHIARIFR